MQFITKYQGKKRNAENLSAFYKRLFQHFL